MKKILFVIIAALFIMQGHAQVKVGVNAGGLYSSWSVKVGGDKDDDYEGLLGFQAGLMADLPLSASLAFQPQVNFVRKGTSIEHGDHHDAIEVSAVDIPLSLVVRSVTNSGKFFFGFGPNIGINLEAHLHEDLDHHGQQDHHDQQHGHDHGKHIDIGNDPGNLKRPDLGARLSAGFTFGNGLTLSAAYVLGVSDLTPETGLVARGNYAAITLGYYFKLNR